MASEGVEEEWDGTGEFGVGGRYVSMNTCSEEESKSLDNIETGHYRNSGVSCSIIL